MRLTLLALYLVFGLMHGASAQSHWMHFAGSSGNEGSAGVAVDGIGNVITAGWFSGIINPGQSLNTAGGADVLLVKTAPNGAYLWAKRFGGSGDDQATGLAVDASGNIFVCGSFSGSMTAGSFTLTSNGLQDVFLLKTDPSGNVLWAQSFGGPLNDVVRAIACDATGRVVITGGFAGGVTFGSNTLISQTDPLNGLPSQDVFVSQLSPSGAFLWTKQGNAPYGDKGTAITTDINGNVYVSGQFSDTITFDLTHFNTAMNAIFLVKFDDQGVEQWFTTVSGGALTTARALCSDGSSAVYLAGDVIGNALFGGPPAQSINSPYPNRVFIAKYGLNGNLNWVHADGSASEVTASSLCINTTGQLSLTGTFRCKFSDYSDFYGQGLFNSVGYRDVYVSRYDTAGNRLWSRQYGGPKTDEANGIADAGAGQIIIAGSFLNRFIYPAKASFLNYENGPGVSMAFNGSYCGDAEYTNYRQCFSAGGSDLFWGKVVDSTRRPYDFYDRTGTSCQFDQVPGCVSTSGADNICNGQITTGCGGITLYANSRNSVILGNSPGPTYEYLWSSGQLTRNNLVNASGTYTATVTSEDGCFTFTDSLTVSINQIPSSPTFSDSKFINLNASFPVPIPLCVSDSVTVTATNVPPNATVTWTLGSTTANGSSFTFHAIAPGAYGLTAVYTEPSGCISTNSVFIYVANDSLSPVAPYISITSPTTICQGDPIVALLMDSLTGLACAITDINSVIWTSTPYAPPGIGGSCTQSQSIGFYPTTSGTYTINCMLIRGSNCGAYDTSLMSISTTVTVLPAATISASVSGNVTQYLCPGDTITLAATGGTSVLWTPGGNNPTINVTTAGVYFANISTTNSYGCMADTTIMRIISYYPAPQLATLNNPAVVCPGDSVGIVVTIPGTDFSWTGPNGPFSINNDTLYASTPGFYYCNVTNLQGCTLISTSAELLQYTTPVLNVTPNTIFCSGDSVELNVYSSATATINWTSPTSGNSNPLYASNSGTYVCSITACGITTIDSAVVTAINVPAQINHPDTIICPGDSVTLIPEPFNGTAVWQPTGITANQLTTGTTGNYYIVVTDPNGCTGISNTVSIQADSLDGPLALITNSDICEGDLLLIISVLGSNVNATWTGPNGFSQSGLSDVTIFNAQPQQSGYYVVTLDNGFCSSSPDSVLINVYDSVPYYTLTSSPPCQGYSVLINTQPALAFNYTWTLPSGATSNNSLITLSPYDSSMAGTYSLQVTNGVCPSFLDSITLPPPGTGSVVITTSDSTGCVGDTLTATATSSVGTLEWQPGLTTGNSYAITNSGQVSCILTDSLGCSFDSNTLDFIFETPPSVTVSSNSPLCEGDTLELIANAAAGSIPSYQFQWNGPGGLQSTQPSLIIPSVALSNSGQYVASVSDSVCGSRGDSLTVNIVSPPAKPNIVSNAPVCLGDTLILEGSDSSGTHWIDPSGNILSQSILVIPSLTAQDSGIYILLATADGCPPSSDSIRIVPDTCSSETIDFAMPNVFTPNSDGINDLFLPDLPEGTEGSMTILNRWGHIVYEGNLLKGWDGKGNEGKDLPESTYYYIVKPVGSNTGMWKSKTGFVELLR